MTDARAATGIDDALIDDVVRRILCVADPDRIGGTPAVLPGYKGTR